MTIFPALDAVAPLVSEAYEKDHRGLDAAFDALNDAVSAGDALATARATAAFKFHLDIHLYKEDTHLYRIVRERIPVPEQGKAVGIMAGEVPEDVRAAFILWMYPLLGDDDRENMTRIQQMVMPPKHSRESSSSSSRRSATTGRSWRGASRSWRRRAEPMTSWGVGNRAARASPRNL